MCTALSKELALETLPIQTQNMDTESDLCVETILSTGEAVVVPIPRESMKETHCPWFIQGRYEPIRFICSCNTRFKVRLITLHNPFKMLFLLLLDFIHT